MNTITKSNQTSFGVKQPLKHPEMIMRKARNTYQHFSPDNVSARIKNKYKLDMNPLYLSSEPYIQYVEKEKNISINRKLLKGLKNIVDVFATYRNILQTCRNKIIFMLENLKNGNKMGNSSEDVTLATLIGRINGQKNIYSGNISGLDHNVAFITDKPVIDGKKMFFKNKDAIIIDPQLGITDFAGNYFLKIKDLIKTPFRKKPHFSVTPSDNFRLNEAQTEDLKIHYPELLIKDYKPVKV